MNRTSHAMKAPTQYPTAAAPPDTMPWNSGPRGSSDGVVDNHRKIVPKMSPAKLIRCA